MGKPTLIGGGGVNGGEKLENFPKIVRFFPTLMIDIYPSSTPIVVTHFLCVFFCEKKKIKKNIQKKIFLQKKIFVFHL